MACLTFVRNPTYPESVSKFNVSKMKYDLCTCQGNRDVGENVLLTIISQTSVAQKKALETSKRQDMASHKYAAGLGTKT